jgi:hypothetical protein
VYCAGAQTGEPIGGIILDGGMNVQRIQSASIGNHAPADTAGTLLRKK